MVFDGMYAKVRKDHANNRQIYLDRLVKTGLQLLADSNYSSGTVGVSYIPDTVEAWSLHKELLSREGTLSDGALSEIKSGLRTIAIQKQTLIVRERIHTAGSIPSIFPERPPLSERDSRTMNGSLEVHLIAMKELGLDDQSEYCDQLATLSRKRHFESVSTDTLFNQRPME